MGYATTNGSESVWYYLAGLVKEVALRLRLGELLPNLLLRSTSCSRRGSRNPFL